MTNYKIRSYIFLVFLITICLNTYSLSTGDTKNITNYPEKSVPIEPYVNVGLIIIALVLLGISFLGPYSQNKKIRYLLMALAIVMFILAFTFIGRIINIPLVIIGLILVGISSLGPATLDKKIRYLLMALAIVMFILAFIFSAPVFIF